MSANKFYPHVLVLPEDDANSQLAMEFHLRLDWATRRQMDVLRVAGGWNKVLERFLEDHVADMNRWPHRYMVLLMDFDGKENRLQVATARIPEHLRGRVFVLGAWTEPEDLREHLGSFDVIGQALAEDREKAGERAWGHELLRHNASELARLRDHVCPILFAAV